MSDPLTEDQRLPMTGAYAPSATCRHGIHPFNCYFCCPPENLSHADLVKRYDHRTRQVSAIVTWLERNQPDVFQRGLWDAIPKDSQ